MKTFGIKKYKNQTPTKHFGRKKYLSSTALKNERSRKMCTKYKVHIFNMWIIFMQSLNKKERKLSDLQITQTRPPLCILDGSYTPFKNEKNVKCAQNTVHIFNMLTIIMQSLNEKE